MSFVAGAYFRVFEPWFNFGGESRRRTTAALRSARIAMLPELYLTLSYLVAAGAAVLTLASVAVLLALLKTIPSLIVGVLAIGSAVFVFSATRLGFLLYPRMRASSRARAIEAEFPSAVTLCYALARGGVNAMEIFRTIAREQGAYGEVSVEFAQVIREVDLAGRDLNSALQSVASTTPSVVLKGFLEGLVTMLNSGADVKDYFKRQAENLLAQASLRVDREVESAGLLAESYVSGLLVLPLLLLVILTVLSVLKSGLAGTFVPIIVFVLIPGGTIAYLILTETMMPAPTLAVPRARPHPILDFGVASLPRALLVLPPPPKESVATVADELKRETEQGLNRRVRVEWARRRLRASWASFVDRALVKPTEVLQVSGLFALLVAAIGAVILYYLQAGGKELTIAATTIGFVALAIALLPVAAFHEMRVSRARRVDGAMPEVLGRLAGFNEKGVSLLKSFQILGYSAPPAVRPGFQTLDRDVSWTANLGGALRRLRERIRTRRMTKLGILFERGVAASGNIKDVLEIAANEATVSEGQESRKRQAMMSYVVVIYVVYAVFLYILYMVTDLFYGPESAFSTLGGGRGVAGLSGGMPADQAQLLFFHAALIQGVASGLVAGKLGESYILSGLKHAFIMGALGWLVFQLAVF